MEQAAVSAIVLAGGASSRMGFNKALARLGRSDSGRGTTLIEQTVSQVKTLSPDVVVVANDRQIYAGLGARVVPDVHPGGGSLVGIYSGLPAVRHSHSIVVACDMPFLSQPLWRYMLSLPRDYDVLMPRLGGHCEPLHSIYSKRCVDPIRELLLRGGRKILDFLDRVNVRYLEEGEIDRFDPEHRSFFNVNTPEDLARAAALWRISPVRQTPPA